MKRLFGFAGVGLVAAVLSFATGCEQQTEEQPAVEVEAPAVEGEEEVEVVEPAPAE